MPDIRPPGPYPLADVGMECWLVRFDKNGVCSSPNTRAALLDRLQKRETAPVIFFSHGWNNDFADAVKLYTAFLRQFEAIGMPNPAPIFVGVIWPSAWFPSDDGPQMAGAESGDGDLRERVTRELLDVLPKSTDWERLYGLLDKERISRDEALELAGLLQPLVDGAQARAGKSVDPAASAVGEGASERAATAENIVRALEEMQRRVPGAKEDDIDEIGVVDAPPLGEALGAAGILDWLDPRWALRLATLYLMKDRAGTVGFTGVGSLLREILVRSKGAVHGVGHSFGAKVLLSAIVSDAMSRKVASLLLLQPAVSYLSFASEVPGRAGQGGYRPVLDRVAGRILTTLSAHDFPLHEIYHLALLRRDDLGDLRVAAEITTAGNPPNAYAALGGYGPRGSGEVLIEPMPEPNKPIDVPQEVRLVGIDGSIDNRIDGHGGVTTPNTAWLLQMQIAQGAR